MSGFLRMPSPRAPCRLSNCLSHVSLFPPHTPHTHSKRTAPHCGRCLRPPVPLHHHPPRGDGEEGRTKSRFPQCVFENFDDVALLLLFQLVFTGITNALPHAEEAGVELPPKEILDFVKNGNIHPEGTRDLASDSATYIRAVAKQEIKDAQDGEDKERAKFLAPLLGLTGEKLGKAAGMRWAHTDIPANANKKFGKTIKKATPGSDINNPTYRDYDGLDGHWIEIGREGSLCACWG